MAARPRFVRNHALARAFAARLAGASALALLAALGPLAAVPALAQSAGTLLTAPAAGAGGGQMLLEADQVVYDNDRATVTAVGNVQIQFNDYVLSARRVTYSRQSGRVVASGGVEIVEPNGSRIFAEEIDITDDFADGFVSALRVETPERTRIAAESAERESGERTVFNNGVYTACEPCRDNPTAPPLWQIRANRVIVDNDTRKVEYEGASFELFGRPIAYAPYFSHADPTIKRKSGFLFPQVGYTENLGLYGRGSYFWAIAPNMDLTLSGTAYSQQGFLGEAEFRHRTFDGEYNLRVAGIDQAHPDAFGSATIDTREDARAAVTTNGAFTINPAWRYGWDGLFQTDENFARTYNLGGYNARDITNQAWLTGLSGKNYFDLRAQRYLVQIDDFDQDPFRTGVQKLQDRQATLLPILDYERVSEDPVYGGEASLKVNVQNVHRHDPDIFNDDFVFNAGLPLNKRANERFHGLAGRSGRASAEGEWKRSDIVGGAVVTTLLAARGDGIWLDTERLASPDNPLVSNDGVARGMATGMMEIRYPLIAQDGFASHLFEPVAQIIARPDETHIGSFPNEDAQSLVFDTSNLFARNKFSGFDRVEGGVRANLGFRYSASFDNGASLAVVAGQSFHLAGRNSFATPDLVNAGIESGLESHRSDYVASATLDNGNGLSVGLGGRFDENDLAFKRGELRTLYANPDLSAALSYVFIDSQPLQTYAQRRHEVAAAGSVKVSERWRVFGSMSYDIETANLYSRGIGLAYDDSCFTFSVGYEETEDRYSGDATGASLLFRIGLRTIGDYDTKYSLSDATE